MQSVRYANLLFSSTLLLAAAAALPAQVSGEPSSQAPAPPAAAWSFKGLNASGWVDSYYNQNFNSPSSRTAYLQGLNITSDKLSMNSITGSLSYDPQPLGFRIDAGWGRTYDSFYLSEPKKSRWDRYLINAYVSLKPKSWKGLQLDFGKFVTSAGAELTESHLNWNYSRSLLFTYGPFFHAGLRATVPVNAVWTTGAQVVTGWNSLRDNNSGKTLGISNLFTLKKAVIANTFYSGPENTGTNKGWRQFSDTVVAFNPARRLSMYVNFDAGHNANPVGPAANWWGIGSAARFALNDRLAITPRFEYFDDKDGFTTLQAQQLKEFTLTGEVKLNASFITRLEWRRDWSNQPYFEVGATPNARHRQTLLTAGVIVVFKPGMFNFGGEAKP